MSNLQFLYLIASGNDDSIYKIGISEDPKRRLAEIKETYKVPRAYIVATMDVATREEVFALENALHIKFNRKRSTKYGGKEFFKLSRDELEWLQGLFNERSNDFAQAKAYYGLAVSAKSLSIEARKLESNRQKQITFNRKNGKIYDTAPKGILKEYNNLKKKLDAGHLGERFQTKTYIHPAMELADNVQQEIEAVIEKGVSTHWLKCAGLGFAGGIIIASINVPQKVLDYGVFGLITGVITGTVSQVRRSSFEKRNALNLVKEAVDKRYPRARQQTMLAMLDIKARKSYLITDFHEHIQQLREFPALIPKVDLPSRKGICDTFKNKKYFPKVASVITLSFTLFVSQANQNSDSDKNSKMGVFKSQDALSCYVL
jgi:predicted GIY-YIG superfamily endonuclease